jgi:hypothetical protein
MKYLKEFLTYNRLGYSYLKEDKTYLSFFGYDIKNDELEKEIETLETDISNKLKYMTNGVSDYTDWTKPEFAERIKKNKDVMNSFMHRMPFSKLFNQLKHDPKNLIDVCSKMIDMTNVETLAQYFSDLFSFLDRIEEVSEKIKKAYEANKENKSLFSLSENYNTWVVQLKDIKSKVESKDFLTKIADEKELQVAYKTKDGGEADGKIIGLGLKDDGGIEFTVDNEKVGEVKKDFDELVMKKGDGKDEGDDKDLVTKLAELKAKNPDDIKRIYNFTDFISKDENKDKSENIYKIMGI